MNYTEEEQRAISDKVDYLVLEWHGKDIDFGDLPGDLRLEICEEAERLVLDVRVDTFFGALAEQEAP